MSRCKPASSFMKIETLNKESMEAMKTLADTNLAISNAKSVLSDIVESKDKFLESREREAVDAVKAVLEKSSNMLNEIGENHESLKEIRGLVTNIVDFARNFSAEISKAKEDLEEGSSETVRTIRRLRLDLEQKEGEIKKSLLSIDSEKKSLEEAWNALRKARKQLDSDQKALALAYQEIQNKKV